MRTLNQIAYLLHRQAKHVGLTQEVLRKNAGISRQTLTNVLSGSSDYKITTLLAIADRLGLELILLPKAAAAGLATGIETSPKPAVKTIVADTLERFHSGGSK